MISCSKWIRMTCNNTSSSFSFLSPIMRTLLPDLISDNLFFPLLFSFYLDIFFPFAFPEITMESLSKERCNNHNSEKTKKKQSFFFLFLYLPLLFFFHSLMLLFECWNHDPVTCVCLLLVLRLLLALSHFLSPFLILIYQGDAALIILMPRLIVACSMMLVIVITNIIPLRLTYDSFFMLISFSFLFWWWSRKDSSISFLYALAFSPQSIWVTCPSSFTNHFGLPYEISRYNMLSWLSIIIIMTYFLTLLNQTVFPFVFFFNLFYTEVLLFLFLLLMMIILWYLLVHSYLIIY